MSPVPAATRAFVERLDEALARDAVILTEDVRVCALAQFGWTIEDVFAFLYVLDESSFHESMPSTAPEGGVIWIFLPMTDEGRLWVRFCERGRIIVVSLHRG